MDNCSSFESFIMPMAFSKLCKVFNKQYDECLKPYGLSKIHGFYLLTLFKNMRGLTLNEMNDYIGCDKANTSRAVADLEDKGIIIKDVQENTEKKFIVRLSDKGKAIAKKFAEYSKKFVEKCLSKLSIDESSEFMRLIKKIVEKKNDSN